MTKFGIVTQVGSMFLGVYHAPIPKAGPAWAYPNFWGDLPTCTQTVWPRVTKFGVVCGAVLACYLGDPSSQTGAGPKHPQVIGSPTCMHTVRETTECSTVITFDARKIFLQGY